jgi:hypothetical protein
MIGTLKPADDGTPSVVNQAALLLFGLNGGAANASKILGLSTLLGNGTITAAEVAAGGLAALRLSLAGLTTWAIQSMLFPVAGTGEMPLMMGLLLMMGTIRMGLPVVLVTLHPLPTPMMMMRVSKMLVMKR